MSSQNQFFAPLENVTNHGPTIQQAAQLAEVTQMAGGVKPLHKSIAQMQPVGGNMQSFGSTKSSDSGSNSSSSPAPVEKQSNVGFKPNCKNGFEFPEGGWECSKC